MTVWRVLDRDVLESGTGQVLLPRVEVVPPSEGAVCGWVLLVRCSMCCPDTAILVEGDGGHGHYPRETMDMVARILARRGHGVAGRSHQLFEPELVQTWVTP